MFANDADAGSSSLCRDQRINGALFTQEFCALLVVKANAGQRASTTALHSNGGIS